MIDFDFTRNRPPLIPLLLAMAAALLLDFIPLPADVFFWMPSFSAILLFFLTLRSPQHFGMLFAFVFGLLVDAGSASPLGQHALAFVLLAFIIQLPAVHAYLKTPFRQTLALFLALSCNQAVILFLNAVRDQQLSHPESFSSALTGLLLWPLLDKVLLSFLRTRRFK